MARFVARLSLASLLVLASVAAAAEQPSQGSPAPAEKHHSKAKGAVVGGTAGAVAGGKKGAAAGAAGGAMVQHHKNKKEAKQAQKAQ